MTVAQERRCAHCGGALRPAARRHARFCSPAHRRAAHRAHNPDPRRGRARFLAGIDAKKPIVSPYYRLKRADGTVSDMTNLARARDALAAMRRAG
jgi:hypothetical protein